MAAPKISAEILGNVIAAAITSRIEQLAENAARSHGVIDLVATVRGRQAGARQP